MKIITVRTTIVKYLIQIDIIYDKKNNLDSPIYAFYFHSYAYSFLRVRIL